MRSFYHRVLLGASLMALSGPAFAQDAPNSPQANEDNSSATSLTDEIIVQARRRDESQQDVPLVVNAVTAESIEKLNIREFKDVASLVPGLSLAANSNGIGVTASLRGVAYDVNASGNNGTIEFYLNDAPLSAGALFQSLFDVGQIEVLRGPQGTLRGRASPSGSITVTTHRPDLSQAGAVVNATVNDIGGWNFNSAINVPIIEDKLGIRVAGVVDEGDGNRIRSINNSVDPFIKTRGGRVSLRAEPADWLSLQGSYTTTTRKVLQFDQVESMSVFNPSVPASPTTIRAGDRLAVQFIPQTYTQKFKIWNWQAQGRFAGQKLDYVGSVTKQDLLSVDPNDDGAFFGSTYSTTLRNAAQTTNTAGKQTTHEVRLSNETRVFGSFDYVVGGLYNKSDVPTSLVVQTPLFAGFFIPQSAFPSFLTTGGITPLGAARGVSLAQIVNTRVGRPAETIEKSLFGNVTAHLGEDTEVSGGVRYINYAARTALILDGNAIAAANEDREINSWIFSASAKHRFNDSLMVYASFGSSWRPGSSSNSAILRDNARPDAAFASLYQVGDEKSKSYEIGFKSDWLNRRLRLNVTAFHQDFKNYAYSSRGVVYGGIDAQGVQRTIQAPAGIAVGVPAKVNGVEGELAFRVTDRWDLSATLSYAKSKISNGRIPCADYSPRDGVPDGVGALPTYAQIIAANGGAQVAFCSINYRAGLQAPFSSTIQSEYHIPISSSVSGYLRGLLNYQSKSQNDPSNVVDDIKAYGIVNLFAGLRDPRGTWEIGGYVKNLFETERVTSRDANSKNVGYQQLFCTTADPRVAGPCSAVLPAGVTTQVFGQTASSSYRAITMTPPREFGITARIAFGSR